jgi:hypothetical protein
MPDDLSAQAPPADGGEDHQEGTDGEQTAELPFIPTTRTHFSSNVPSGQSSAIDASTGSLVQASDFFADDEDDEWQVRTPPKRLRLRVPTAVLVGLLIAAGAFWGGAAAQRSHGTTSSGSGAAAAFRALAGARGASGASGFASFFGGEASSAAAVGTLTEVKGSTLYLTNAAGNIVTVVLGPSAKITRTASTSAAGLGLGDTIVVQGVTAKNGTVTATSVTATAAGTTTTGGLGAASLGSGG